MRRSEFAGAFGGAIVAGLSGSVALAADRLPVLWLRREGSDEEVRASLRLDGTEAHTDGYRQICWLMRDHAVPFAQGYVQLDVALIWALFDVQRALALRGIGGPLVVTSGYRCSQTNEATEGAAHNSQHLYAKAADIYVEGFSMRELFAICQTRADAGGTGYYADHVHVDSGEHRSWVGWGPA
jgi:uncharacterized protein YcbK (DUF882 family)